MTTNATVLYSQNYCSVQRAGLLSSIFFVIHVKCPENLKALAAFSLLLLRKLNKHTGQRARKKEETQHYSQLSEGGDVCSSCNQSQCTLVFVLNMEEEQGSAFLVNIHLNSASVFLVLLKG